MMGRGMILNTDGRVQPDHKHREGHEDHGEFSFNEYSQLLIQTENIQQGPCGDK